MVPTPTCRTGRESASRRPTPPRPLARAWPPWRGCVGMVLGTIRECWTGRRAWNLTRRSPRTVRAGSISVTTGRRSRRRMRVQAQTRTDGWEPPTDRVPTVEDNDVSDPLLSVVIPTWNRCRLVGDAIDSALMQDGGRVEVIVVVDGSTDGTSDMLARRYG